MPSKRFFLALIAFLPACGQEEMRTYTIPKDPVSERTAPSADPMSALPPGHPEVSPDMAASAGAQPGEAHVTWRIPAGWTEEPGSGFRYATLRAPAREGGSAEVAVTVLRGEAGGLLPNVNRWRGQIGLEPVDEAGLAPLVRTVRPGGRKMTLVDLVSRDSLIEGQFRRRLLTAIVQSEGDTWFFKFQGAEPALAAAEKDFMEFLGSLKGL